ncbi:MAG: nucleotidyltransferase domain-containing protein [Lachnospiraceae bacterium]|nr:nucleotidyltransferase domain-containing protein [Lachnospiraceae bacterium]
MIENTGIREEILWEIQKLAKDCGLKRVLLFGSRARGDYRKTSDIDLAVSGGDTVRFSLEAEEVISTLLFFDVVNLDGPVQKELLESIQREGKILYEEV